MAYQVKLYGVEVSPFVGRVKIALNLKGIKYEYIEEDLDNKSPDLVKYNPVYKKVPVLVHNGNPISESLVIIEYIDDVWEGLPIMPIDAYEKAQARFWANFIADKCHPALINALGSHGEEQDVAEAHKQLQFLENELNAKGNKFFGGDNINLVDIFAGYIAFWVAAAEEALGIEVVTKDKFPKITEWCGNYLNCQVVKDGLPPKESLVAYYKQRVKIALNLKGIKYELIQEDLNNKSPDLLKYNPVHKKVPVLIHNGNPISESVVIVEYVDDVWKEVPIMPNDAYQKAQARFWVKFIVEKVHRAIFKAISSHGEEQTVAEAHEQLQFLENELNVKGCKFFGGDSIGLVDVCAGYTVFWAGAAEEAIGISKVVSKDKFPKIIEWCDNCINCQVFKDGLPPRESLVAYYKRWFGVPIMPVDAYEKARARFWAKFIDDKFIPAIFKAFVSHGEEQDILEANEQLQFLENELNVKGNKFFGGDNINLVDICAGYIAFWAGAAEEALGIEVVTKDKFPKLTEWCHNYTNCQVVKDNLPPRESLVAYYKWLFGKE
ncbi:hypothetical protein M8C21_021221 [Ambrosia artemisiifolia]|uniref:Probable glutathione S-transferase n=1 Tax=Ambrosia artemisiifolia TaxID=4212 RepID=A0AAD5CX65_AMBAR|nr:hypothetical protein M8C21_021221 [Ambrosia artemisiifolia]